MPNLVLIGQSHAVALLDAICDWRRSFQLETGTDMERDYSPAFRGWMSVNTSGPLVQPAMHPAYADFQGLRIRILSAATFAGELATLSSIEDGKMRLAASDALLDFIRSVGHADIIISAISGNRHSKLTLVGSFPAYDFAPYACSVEGQPIDRLYINALLAQLGTMVAAPLACLRSAFPQSRIIHIVPPPPLRDPAAATSHEVLRAELAEHGFTSPGLRQKWHVAYVNQLTSQLSSMGIELVSADPGAIAHEGFLRPEFAEGLTHGNVDYGHHLASALRAKLQSPPR